VQWTTPLVIEVDPMGSDIAQAMLAGCLWSWFALAFSAHPAGAGNLRGIVGLEDMHMLFHPSHSALRVETIPTAALLRTFAQRGVGTLLIDERPDLLDHAATGSTGVVILTRTGNSDVHVRLAQLVGADQRQQARMRRLGVPEAIVKQAGMLPVLILTER